jgi:hypothetical protein
MTAPHRRRVLALATALAATMLLAVPALSGAALPSTSVTGVTWRVRTSWVRYVTNPGWFVYTDQGSITPTGGARATGSEYTTWGDDWTEYSYNYAFAASDDLPASPRTVRLTGGLDFDMSVHGIDISLSDLRVVKSGSSETLVGDASYKPLLGSTVTRGDIALGDLVAVTGIPNQVQLTRAGAEVFNGGSNGSYRAGQEFGSLTY